MQRRVRITQSLACCVAIAFASTSWAIPTLQVGAPGGAGEGIYADYVAHSTNPTEDDSAVTSGSIIYAAGAWGPNTLALGGQYLSGDDWSDFDLAVFDGWGAVLMLSLPDGKLATALANLTINGNLAGYSSTTSLFPNNHAPVKDNISDFLFFDIGEFGNAGSVPNLVDETGSAKGEIKTLTLGGTSAAMVDWIHFDLMAIETDRQGQSAVKSKLQNNPGSHDITWRKGEPDPDSDPDPDPEVPAPGSLMLTGLGLLLLNWKRRSLRA